MIAEPSMPDRRPSPGLSLNLSSNNPFRNRAGSPANLSPAPHTPASAGERPMSRNPFLQTFEAEFNKEASNPQLIDMSASMKESPKKATFGNTAEELFNNLTLDDGKREQGAPPRSGTHPHPGHRPSRSEQEEGEHSRSRGPPRGAPRPRGPPDSRGPHRRSPDRRENRRPRRNSESSMVDKGSLDPYEERRRRERRRERDERTRDGKSRSGKVRRPQGLDVIDKLDVSGIYGPSLIHHDGPYDAVQPHRNRKKDMRAPMSAFPMGSANNALGGNGPVNSKIDLDKIHGRGAEGFTDFGGTERELRRPDGEDRSASYNPKDRADIIHGEESRGLGTSTFLDGTPASRAAIAEYETQKAALDAGGIGRKKSIAQRFRGISQPRRYGDGLAPRITSPEIRYGAGQSPIGPQSASAAGASKANEPNPFFDDYSDAYDKKGASIKVSETERDTPAREAPSPRGRAPMTRSITTDGLSSPNELKPNGNGGGGFLNRVKSLKGGRRPRPERPERPERPA